MASSTGGLWSYRSYFIIVAVPLLLIPILIYIDDAKGKCGYMMILMGTYWVTEVIPLGATGLIPVFMAPMFGLLTSTEVAVNYMKDVTVMLTGGIFVALAIERSNLHKRIALGVLKLVGTTPKWLMLGFMLPTFFCSMFISNTATTAMMLPIMEAVLKQLADTPEGREPNHSTQDGQHNAAIEVEDVTFQAPADEKFHTIDGSANGPDKSGNIIMTELDPNGTSVNTFESKPAQTQSDRGLQSTYFKNMAKGMTLSVCYAANVGGTATLTGTNPNIILKGHADELWTNEGLGESPVSYSSWIPFGLPTAVINFVFIYLWLVLFYFGWRAFKCTENENPEQKTAVKAIINREYARLGKLKYAEVASASMFVLLILLWFFRNPGFMDGWSKYFKEGYVSDAVPAVLIATALFCMPMYVCGASTRRNGRVEALLTWQDVHEKFPWSILFLMGGGFSLAQCAQVSGLSEWIGDQLLFFRNLPGFVMVAIICFFVAMLTEVTSNSATSTILMPIMGAMAVKMGKNPLYLMLPTAISTSYAFMLPVATPPNAIAFSYGRLQVIDMIKGGAILNFLCVFTVTLATHTWGFALFDFNNIPWETSNGGSDNVAVTMASNWTTIA